MVQSTQSAVHEWEPNATVSRPSSLALSGAFRKVAVLLARLIKKYERELAGIRDKSHLVVAEIKTEGARYLLLKVPLRRARALTERELEVALLAAEGLSNREVGKRLSITAATVAAHLRRSYEKLNIKSRAGLLPALLHGND